MNRQYLIRFGSTPSYAGMQLKKIENLNILHGDKLDISHHHGNNTILLIGYILDPTSPDKTNAEILEDLDLCNGTNEFFKKLQTLSGRYIIIYKNEKDFIATSDALGLRNLLYGSYKGDFVLTSSIKLFLDVFDEKLVISKEKKDFIASEKYIVSQNTWIGSTTIDDRFTKVLPNHYLCLQSKTIQRAPLFLYSKTENDALEYIQKIIQGNLKAIKNRFQLLQPITAGWDSRTLLAASKEIKDHINYYVFTRKDNKYNPDVSIPPKLAKQLQLNFKVIKTTPLQDDFLKVYKANFIFPRILPKTQNIQYHYFHHREGNYVNINGNGAGVFKNQYPKSAFESSESALKFLGYEDNNFVKEQINAWFSESKDFAKSYNLKMSDLFYWEIRMGNWGELYPREQDIAIEEFSPFNNKELLLSILLNIDERKREAPTYTFYQSLMSSMWPEVLDFPINPPSSDIRGKIKKLIKRLPLANTVYKVLKRSNQRNF